MLPLQRAPRVGLEVERAAAGFPLAVAQPFAKKDELLAERRGRTVQRVKKRRSLAPAATDADIILPTGAG